MLTKKNLLLLLLAVVICIVPIILITDSEFGGADGEAEEAIAEINQDYEPWFEPLWEPPGGETESLLFALQAAVGAGILGYGIGFLKGKSSNKKAGGTEPVRSA